MTTQTLRRQVDRLKADLDALKPKPEPKITVLMEPGHDAEPAVIADYLEKLAQAQHNQDNIMVLRLVPLTKESCPARDDVPGVRYVNSEWEARLAILAGQRSERGNVNRLDDVLKGLSGNVLGAVANPPPDIHTSRMRGRTVETVEDDD